MKRNIIGLVCGLLCLMLLGACGGTPANPGASSDPGLSPDSEATESMTGSDSEMVAMLRREIPVRLYGDTLVYDATKLGVPTDGESDAADAIEQACAQILEKGGGILYFPSGEYALKRGITISGGADTAPLILAGDNGALNGTTFTVDKTITGCILTVARPNTHLAYLTIQNRTADASGISLESDGGSVAGCSVVMSNARNPQPAVVISGSYNIVKESSMGRGSGYSIHFTKIPGRRAYGNVLSDCYFGGTGEKCALVSSEDPEGAQEELLIARNVFLISAEPEIEVRSVYGLRIVNDMLDCCTKSVCIDAEGFGVWDVLVQDCYLGTSKGGVHMLKDGGGVGSGIRIADNYLWSPESVWVLGNNYDRVSLEYDYFVLTGGNAVYMNTARAAQLRQLLVANIGASACIVDIVERDALTVLEDNNFGGTEQIAEPSELNGTAPEKPVMPEAPARPEVTEPAVYGDTKIVEVAHDDYINVLDCGAAGDGVQDDTKAVKKAINTALSRNRSVYFPAGTYRITETIRISKDDSKRLRFKGDGADVTTVLGDASLDGPIFYNAMKYNFSVRDMHFDQQGTGGSCIETLFIQVSDCHFTAVEGNPHPLLTYHGSDCRVTRCTFDTRNAEAYSVYYSMLESEISINDYIIDNTFTGIGKGVLVGDGKYSTTGRCEGLKIHGNTFENTGETQIEVYETIFLDIAYNTMRGAKVGILLSNRGSGPDGIYINHNDIAAVSACVASAQVDGGGDYISMIVIHDNVLQVTGKGQVINQVVPFNKSMIHDNLVK